MDFESAFDVNTRVWRCGRRIVLPAAGSDLATARALLKPGVRRSPGCYADGIEIFGQELSTLADIRSAGLDARAWLEPMK